MRNRLERFATLPRLERSRDMPNKVRVLFVDHEHRLSGGQQDLLDLVRALDPARVEVHAALPAPGPLEDGLRTAGALVHRLPMDEGLRRLSRWALARHPMVAARRAIAFCASTWRLARLIRRLRPDVVHTNSMKAHVVAAVPTLVLRVPLVWHVRDILERGWVRSAFVSLGAVAPARIVCLSKAAGAQFDGSRARRKVRVVYNGIWFDRFQAGSSNGWRARLGVSNGHLLVGMVAQIIDWKGQDVFIEAAAKLAESRPHLRFAVVGDVLFPENDGGFSRRLRERARELGLDGRLVWTGWIDDVTGAISSLDVLVHASKLPEPFGRVVVEAMAAGVPVVASAAGAPSELVPVNAGRLVRPGDAAAVAEAVGELLDRPEERSRCRDAARTAARRFDISHTAEGVMTVYGEVLGCV